MSKIDDLLDNCQFLLDELNNEKVLKDIHGILTTIKQNLIINPVDLIYYKPEHFKLKEMFPPELIANPEYTEIELWSMMNPKITWTADRIRELYDERMYINVKAHTDRGFRAPDCEDGSYLSAHKRGDGIDFNLERTSPMAVRADIIENPFKDEFKYITCMEMDITWNHIDCRNWDKATHGILKIYPK